MSTATLTNLRDYLYDTLSPANMIWLGKQLTEYGHHQQEEFPLKRYTMEDINAMLDAAEAEIAAGKTISHEESMRRWKEKVARKKKDQELAEAV